MEKVFVYGSLKEGFHNHCVIKDSGGKLLAKDYRLDGFSMFSLRAFPAIVPNHVDSVYGEIYEVDDLEYTDYLEGYPHFYDRKEVETEFGKAWVYFHHEQPTDAYVASGVW